MVVISARSCILFVYFLALPSLLHSTNYLIDFYTCTTIHICSITCCVLALSQRNIFYSKCWLLTRSIRAQKKVVSKLESKFAPPVCEAGSLPSERLGSVKYMLSDASSILGDSP